MNLLAWVKFHWPVFYNVWYIGNLVHTEVLTVRAAFGIRSGVVNLYVWFCLACKSTGYMWNFANCLAKKGGFWMKNCRDFPAICTVVAAALLIWNRSQTWTLKKKLFYYHFLYIFMLRYYTHCKRKH